MKGYLFFDIDGTLVDSANHKGISEETRKALHQAKANGYGCLICSGRNFGGLQDYTNIGMDGYVYSDGAGIRIEGMDPVCFPIPEELMEELENLVLNELGGEMLVSSDVNFYASKGQYELWQEYIRQAGGSIDFAKGLHRLEERNGAPAMEIDIDLPDEETEKKFIARLNPRLDYISTTASYGRGSRSAGEVTASGINKGEGIRRAVKMLGGDINHTYGFGDSMNDASMFEACAYGICMGNGAEELKQLADYVTADISEEGLAAAMRHFGIID